MSRLRSTWQKLFFAVEVIRFYSFYDYVGHSFFDNRPFAAVWVITRISAASATARVIRNDVVNKIFVTGVGKLMRFARLKEKRVARGYDCRSILITNTAAPRNHEIKLRFG